MRLESSPAHWQTAALLRENVTVGMACGSQGRAVLKRDELADLTTFLVVAEEGNFTRAAARIGVSQSAVSHTIRRLEAALALRLLNRTSRRVTTTEAGEKLLATLRPSLMQINARIEELRSLEHAPSGLVRVTTSATAARTILWPVVSEITRDFPEVQIELNLESRLADIAGDRFDAGVRLGEHLGNDMIAVGIGPKLRMAVVGSPALFQRHGVPEHPRDLARYPCINLRFGPHAPIYAWEFEKDDHPLKVRVDGPLILNDAVLCATAAEEGRGLAFLMESDVTADIEAGRLRRVLEDWCPPFPGFHLYYSSRRQVSSALRLLIDRLREQARASSADEVG